MEPGLAARELTQQRGGRGVDAIGDAFTLGKASGHACNGGGEWPGRRALSAIPTVYPTRLTNRQQRASRGGFAPALELSGGGLVLIGVTSGRTRIACGGTCRDLARPTAPRPSRLGPQLRKPGDVTVARLAPIEKREWGGPTRSALRLAVDQVASKSDHIPMR